MSISLTTAAELAEQFGISERRLHDLRRENGWPCIRLGKSDFRFTESQGLADHCHADRGTQANRSAEGAAGSDEAQRRDQVGMSD